MSAKTPPEHTLWRIFFLGIFFVYNSIRSIPNLTKSCPGDREFRLFRIIKRFRIFFFLPLKLVWLLCTADDTSCVTGRTRIGREGRLLVFDSHFRTRAGPAFRPRRGWKWRTVPAPDLIRVRFRPGWAEKKQTVLLPRPLMSSFLHFFFYSTLDVDNRNISRACCRSARNNNVKRARTTSDAGNHFRPFRTPEYWKPLSPGQTMTPAGIIKKKKKKKNRGGRYDDNNNNNRYKFAGTGKKKK